MALSDHVRNDARNSMPWRYGVAELAPSDRPRFRSGNDNQRRADEEGPADELDCLRGVLAPDLLRVARLRARELGTGADQVLIRQGVIDEDAYLQRLAFHTGLALEPFSGVERGDLPLPDPGIAQAAELGLLPVLRNGGVDFT